MNYDMNYHDGTPPAPMVGRASSTARMVHQTSPFDSFGFLPGAAQIPKLESSSSETTSQEDEEPQLRKSCDYCVKMKRGCDGGTPCELCKRRKKFCVRSVKKRSGPAKGTKYCKRRARKSPPEDSASPPAKAPPTTSPAGAKESVRRQTDRKTPSIQSPSVTNAPVLDPVSAKVKRTLTTKPQPRAGNKASFPTPTAPSTSVVQCDVKKPKDVKEEKSCEEEPAAPAVAHAVQASQEGWTDRSLHVDSHTSSNSHCESMPPFLSLGQTGDCAATSTSAPSSHDYGLGSRNSKQELPASPRQPGSIQNVGLQGWTAAWHSGLSHCMGSSTVACSQNTMRLVGARRGSLEEALYGSLDKRPSYASWIDIQDLDMDMKTLSSLRWAHHGTTRDNATPWTDASGGNGAEIGASRSSLSSELMHPASDNSCSADQGSHGFTVGARPTGGPAAATATLDDQSSLRDLLLEKWPPVPVSEVSLAEGTW